MAFLQQLRHLRPEGNPDAADPQRPEGDFHADPFAAVLALPMLFVPAFLAMHAAIRLGVPEPDVSSHARFEWSAPFYLFNLAMLLGYGWSVGRRIGWGSGTAARTLKLWVVYFCAWLVLLYGYLLLMAAWGHPVPPQSHLSYFFERGPGDPPWWMVAVVVVLVGPICEELVFRGMIQDMLRKVFDPLSGIVLAALLFGLIHGVQYAAPLAVAGLFFGWLRERTGGVLAPMMAHCLHNGAVLAMATAMPDVVRQMYAL